MSNEESWRHEKHQRTNCSSNGFNSKSCQAGKPIKSPRRNNVDAKSKPITDRKTTIDPCECNVATGTNKMQKVGPNEIQTASTSQWETTSRNGRKFGGNQSQQNEHLQAIGKNCISPEIQLSEKCRRKIPTVEEGKKDHPIKFNCGHEPSKNSYLNDVRQSYIDSGSWLIYIGSNFPYEQYLEKNMETNNKNPHCPNNACVIGQQNVLVTVDEGDSLNTLKTCESGTVLPEIESAQERHFVCRRTIQPNDVECEFGDEENTYVTAFTDNIKCHSGKEADNLIYLKTCERDKLLTKEKSIQEGYFLCPRKADQKNKACGRVMFEKDEFRDDEDTYVTFNKITSKCYPETVNERNGISKPQICESSKIPSKEKSVQKLYPVCVNKFQQKDLKQREDEGRLEEQKSIENKCEVCARRRAEQELKKNEESKYDREGLNQYYQYFRQIEPYTELLIDAKMSSKSLVSEEVSMHSTKSRLSNTEVGSFERKDSRDHLSISKKSGIHFYNPLEEQDKELLMNIDRSIAGCPKPNIGIIETNLVKDHFEDSFILENTTNLGLITGVKAEDQNRVSQCSTENIQDDTAAKKYFRLTENGAIYDTDLPEDKLEIISRDATVDTPILMLESDIKDDTLEVNLGYLPATQLTFLEKDIRDEQLERDVSKIAVDKPKLLQSDIQDDELEIALNNAIVTKPIFSESHVQDDKLETLFRSAPVATKSTLTEGDPRNEKLKIASSNAAVKKPKFPKSENWDEQLEIASCSKAVPKPKISECDIQDENLETVLRNIPTKPNAFETDNRVEKSKANLSDIIAEEPKSPLENDIQDEQLTRALDNVVAKVPRSLDNNMECEKEKNVLHNTFAVKMKSFLENHIQTDKLKIASEIEKSELSLDIAETEDSMPDAERDLFEYDEGFMPEALMEITKDALETEKLMLDIEMHLAEIEAVFTPEEIMDLTGQSLEEESEQSVTVGEELEGFNVIQEIPLACIKEEASEDSQMLLPHECDELTKEDKLTLSIHSIEDLRIGGDILVTPKTSEIMKEDRFNRTSLSVAETTLEMMTDMPKVARTSHPISLDHDACSASLCEFISLGKVLSASSDENTLETGSHKSEDLIDLMYSSASVPKATSSDGLGNIVASKGTNSEVQIVSNIESKDLLPSETVLKPITSALKQSITISEETICATPSRDKHSVRFYDACLESSVCDSKEYIVAESATSDVVVESLEESTEEIYHDSETIYIDIKKSDVICPTLNVNDHMIEVSELKTFDLKEKPHFVVSSALDMETKEKNFVDGTSEEKMNHQPMLPLESTGDTSSIETDKRSVLISDNIQVQSIQSENVSPENSQIVNTGEESHTDHVEEIIDQILLKSSQRLMEEQTFALVNLEPATQSAVKRSDHSETNTKSTAKLPEERKIRITDLSRSSQITKSSSHNFRPPIPNDSKSHSCGCKYDQENGFNAPRRGYDLDIVPNCPCFKTLKQYDPRYLESESSVSKVCSCPKLGISRTSLSRLTEYWDEDTSVEVEIKADPSNIASSSSFSPLVRKILGPAKKVKSNVVVTPPEISGSKLSAGYGQTIAQKIKSAFGKKSEWVQPEPESGLNYLQELPHDLKTGTRISISGFIKPRCTSFSVNLICSAFDPKDIAFHFNPRLLQHYIVRNSRFKGVWNTEETAMSNKFNIKPNTKFEMNILLAESEFLVSYNDKHLCSYPFKVPLNKLTAIEVNGHLEIYGVEYKDVKIYPQELEQNYTFTIPLGTENLKLEQALDIPLTGLLPEGLKHGWQLEIHGRVKILPHSFTINLQEGPQIWPRPTIPLHFNTKYSIATGEILFNRNAWMGKGWGQEERCTGLQFSPASPFTLAIRREIDHFAVFVNRILTGEFKFRGDVDRINTVYIEGDVVINNMFVDKDPRVCFV